MAITPTLEKKEANEMPNATVILTVIDTDTLMLDLCDDHLLKYLKTYGRAVKIVVVEQRNLIPCEGCWRSANGDTAYDLDNRRANCGARNKDGYICNRFFGHLGNHRDSKSIRTWR